MTQSFTVRLRREFTVERYGEVEVKASTPAEAVRLALQMADAGQVEGLVCDEGDQGTTFAVTGDPVTGRPVSGHDG